MFQFKEGDLPILATPNVNTRNLDRLRAVLVGSQGELYAPLKRIDGDTIGYRCINLGLDVAIRSEDHIDKSLNRELVMKIEEILPIPELDRFNRQKDAILGINATEKGKFLELLWFFHQARNYYRDMMDHSAIIAGDLAGWNLFKSGNQRAYGNRWSDYLGVVTSEMATVVGASSRIKAKPYLETAQDTIHLVQGVPSSEELGDSTYEVWKDFVREGRAQKLFLQMQTNMARTLREHADPNLCCPTREIQVAA